MTQKISLINDVQNEAYTTYVPTWLATSVNPAINNGSITGKYFRMGNNVTAKFEIIPGSTTSFGTGTYSFGLPFATTNERWLGQGTGLRTGVNFLFGPLSNTDINFAITTGSAVILQSGGAIGSATAAWANGDKFVGEITFEVP